MATPLHSTARRAVLAAGALALACLLVFGYLWWTTPPQMGSDKEVFAGVDALFTALTAQDAKLLAQCEQRLHALRDARKLPPAAAQHLDGVIRTARAGRWQAAAETLYGFMRAQRRDGASSRRQPR